MKSLSSHSGSSSCIARGKDKVSLERPFCYYGIPSKLPIYGKTNSFGRRFYNFQNYMTYKQGEFFEWIDIEIELNTC